MMVRVTMMRIRGHKDYENDEKDQDKDEYRRKWK